MIICRLAEASLATHITAEDHRPAYRVTPPAEWLRRQRGQQAAARAEGGGEDR
jgi:hypothetical protein